jgi:hypothetical protein
VARYLYILSLERSGSTPLAWNLGMRPGVIALGEIDRAFVLMTREGSHPREVCTCGATVEACLGAELGPETVVVDASKSLETWRVLEEAAPGRAAAVHLVKDVRGYLDSTLRRMETMDRARLWAEPIARRPVRARLMRAMPQSVVYLLRWVRQNEAMAAALARGGTPWLRVGYEALCREPERSLAAMARLAGAGGGPAGPHILYGSFAYLDGGGAMTLRQDERWRASPRRATLERAARLVAGRNRNWAAGGGSGTTLDGGHGRSQR